MDRPTLSDMRYAAIRWASRLSWPWIATLGLLVFCMGIFLSVVIPAQRESDALRQHLSALQKQLHGSERTAATLIRNATPAQLAVFYNYFSAEQSMPDDLQKIVNDAQENQLSLKQGDYRIARDKSGKMLRYQITLPISGSYRNIRKFLSRVLSDIPTLSLDGVKFERKKIGDGAIEANIEMSLYFVPGRPS